MALALKLSDVLVEAARPYAAAMHRSVTKQIEHWAQLGRCAEENPDLSIDLIRSMLVSQQEIKAGLTTNYKFG